MAIKCRKCQFENPDDSIYCGKYAAPLNPSEDIEVTETIEAPKEELPRGTTIANRYEIIEELATGGMGRVYRVEDKKRGEELELKLIKPEISADKKTMERFSNELKLAHKISHRNVCRRVGERVEGAHKKDIIICCLRLSKKIFFFLWLIVMSSMLTIAQEKKLREPDVRYEPSPQHVVELMLKLANVHKGDIVYDLGCGDGRIVITAVKLFGATGVGIDIDPARIEESRQNAGKAGVLDRVTFRNEDLFVADIQEATVVTLFLSRSANLKLRPKLFRELKPGSRVVSYYWDMGDWKPDKQIESDGDPIYIWTIPTNKAIKKWFESTRSWYGPDG